MRVRALGLGLAALALAGCSIVPPPVVTPTPTPTPTLTFVAPPQPTLGLVGSGTLSGVSFEIRWDGTDFGITGLSQLSNPETAIILVSAAPQSLGSCSSGYGLTFGGRTPAGVPMPISGKQVAADPTFLTSISEVGALTAGCNGTILSTAAIDWAMTPLYPHLVVTDSGDTGGARGVTSLEGETPVSYLVHQGDVRDEIAARFGITPTQLAWLNPRRDLSTIDTVLTGETLNLSPTGR